MSLYWACAYCGKPVPDDTEHTMFLCCGEVGHTELVDYDIDEDEPDKENMSVPKAK